MSRGFNRRQWVGWVVAAFAVLGLGLGAVAHAEDQDSNFRPFPGIQVKILSPKNGEKVPQHTKIAFSMTGGKMKAKYKRTAPGEGHFWVTLDKPQPAGYGTAGGPPGAHNQWIFGSETTMDIPADPEGIDITVQFVDGANRSYGPEASYTVHVTVDPNK
jgi:hypothetical protein